ncbi:Polyketide cyclase / dehydrase and lipid transport [Thalassoglobus neptunius]|uniref:Polyketide cyclase / dehydrase and lipid transport n=1 Tax=Thalassoglobus neptunius TaxID=1938619 RepID=A0A5C5VY89_9PLAN|nr:SRPBCC family protein [Thalassoglobus neptunius]TWT43596.1 Polyketide cyclase / dehydrase and lipid transport [Thalassoglobus neptunius]
MADRIDITSTGPDWQLSCEQFLDAPIDEVFQFFGDAENLEAITPPWLNFKIVTPRPIPMQEGTLIDYRLALRKIPIRWRTKITEWNPPCSFTDEQIRGPYRKWIHQHTFIPKDNGTQVSDHVYYNVPGPRFLHDRLVNRDLRRIFQFRQEVIAQKFHETNFVS